jgi:membrane protein YdbS with pleckstrin-like domain
MSPQLLAGETEIVRTRSHWSAIVPAIVVGAVLLIGGLILISLVPSRLLNRSVSGIKEIAVLVLIFAVIVAVGLRLLRWRCATFTLTNRRIVVSSGVVSRVMESISLDRVQDTVIRKPLVDRLIRAGDIEIESAGREGVEVLHRIPHADAFYNEILQAIEAHRMGGGYPPAEVAAPGYGSPPPPPPASGYGPFSGV